MVSWAHILPLAVFIGVTAVPAKPPRSSDPEVDLPQENGNLYDHSQVVPEILTGQPPTMAFDIPGPALSPDDFQLQPDINQDPVMSDPYFDATMMAGLFQGDILFNSREELAQFTIGTDKNAIVDMDRRWTDAIIPYVISSSYATGERNSIAMAMKSFHDNTCIQFVPRTTEPDYIHILKGDGCSSSVGMIGGAQAVSLGPGCVHSGIAMHELMHAAGFWHEQSRSDRDTYIHIDYSNIKDGMEYNFQKYDWNTIQNLGVGYDLGSIMHYGKYAFAADRSKPTIIPHRAGVEIGQRTRFSAHDIKKLGLLYQCNEKYKPGVTPKPPVKPTAPDCCVDHHKYCAEWATTGECDRNPVWMKANCKQSCQQCATGCKDYHQFCKEWSRMGECTRNPAYMNQYCMKSCGVCDNKGGSGQKCKDKHKYCEAWSAEGQCNANPDYMKSKCAKSCCQC